MSVLIRGMEMPKKKNGAVLIIYPDGRCAFEDGTEYTAVPVPPHGRLIDEKWLKEAMITTLEALKKNPKMDRQEMHLLAAFDTLRVMVEDAPTIIPAEEGE